MAKKQIDLGLTGLDELFMDDYEVFKVQVRGRRDVSLKNPLKW